MTKRMILMLIIVALVLGGVFGWKTFQGMMMKKYMMAGMPPQTVSTIKASMQDWQPLIQAVGSLRAVNGADLSSEVAGIVDKVSFDSGTDVEQGALLVQLRDDDDVAKVHALAAATKIASINYERDLKQIKMQAISQAVVDNDQAGLENAKAQEAAQQAIVDKKTIRAPFAGHVGIRLVDVGQFLNPGTAIVTLQQLDPIYVDFSIPEQALSRISIGQKVSLHIEAHPDQAFAGEVTAINSKIDETTRNVMVRATFKNPDHLLLPGMYGKVDIDVGQPIKYLTLPQTAIVYNTYGNIVYLVRPKKSDDQDIKAPSDAELEAQQSVVITGETRGDQVAIVSGIKDGDEVVTSGQVKLRNGTPVIVNNEVQPSNDPNPKPHEE